VGVWQWDIYFDDGSLFKRGNNKPWATCSHQYILIKRSLWPPLTKGFSVRCVLWLMCAWSIAQPGRSIDQCDSIDAIDWQPLTANLGHLWPSQWESLGHIGLREPKENSSSDCIVMAWFWSVSSTEQLSRHLWLILLNEFNSHHITFFCAFNRGDWELHIPLLKVYRTTIGKHVNLYWHGLYVEPGTNSTAR